MKSPRPVRDILIALALLLLGACGRANPQLRASAFPADVLLDPGERFRLIEQLRTQVVSSTQRLHPLRWRYLVRPALGRQLERAGLEHSDVAFLLWEIDQAKGPMVR